MRRGGYKPRLLNVQTREGRMGRRGDRPCNPDSALSADWGNAPSLTPCARIPYYGVEFKPHARQRAFGGVAQW